MMPVSCVKVAEDECLKARRVLTTDLMIPWSWMFLASRTVLNNTYCLRHLIFTLCNRKLQRLMQSLVVRAAVANLWLCESDPRTMQSPGKSWVVSCEVLTLPLIDFTSNLGKSSVKRRKIQTMFLSSWIIHKSPDIGVWWMYGWQWPFWGRPG